MTELHHLTALEQRAALDARDISSVELTTHYLSRIDRYGDSLGAFISVFHEGALESARTADAYVGDRGPVHGLPLALKDLHPTAGLRTTMGSAALADWLPPADAPVVGALRAGGAVITGKTNAPEFGPVCYTETVFGNAVTPYDLTLSASGSSGGGAAATAAGLMPVGHASDGLGSIRTPAANCGLVGVKPTRGRFPGSGTDWMSLAVEGPVARTVADAALFLDALGPMGPGELWLAHPWEPGAHTRAVAQVPEVLRVGVLTDPVADVEVHADCLQAVALTRQALLDLGHQVDDVPLDGVPSFGDLEQAIFTNVKVRTTRGASLVVPPEKQHLLMPFTQYLIAQAPHVTALEIVTGQSQIAVATMAWLRVLSRYDVVLTPTTTAPPQPTGGLRLDDAEESGKAMLKWSAFTPWANFSGSPCISLPVHRTSSGVPIGVMITALPNQDATLLSLAQQLEGVFEWQHVHPPQFTA